MEVKIMIQGLSHFTFIVHDIERTARLFEDVFDAKDISIIYSRNTASSTCRHILAGAIATSVIPTKINIMPL